MTPARVVLLAQAEVSENDGHDDHDSDDGNDVHDVPAHQRSTDTFTLDGRRRLPSWTWSIPSPRDRIVAREVALPLSGSRPS